MPVQRRSLLSAGLAGLIGLAAERTHGQAVAAEAEVKAAYLHKFAGFVDWPPGAFGSVDAPLVIGVAGAEPVAEALSQLLRQRVAPGVRPTELRRMTAGTPARPEEPLHVLHVGADTGRAGLAWLATYRGRPVLTVTDAPAGLASGAILAFVLREGRVRFEASTPAAQAAGLRLSSRLLAVASRVQETD